MVMGIVLMGKVAMGRVVMGRVVAGRVVMEGVSRGLSVPAASPGSSCPLLGIGCTARGPRSP